MLQLLYELGKFLRHEKFPHQNEGKLSPLCINSFHMEDKMENQNDSVTFVIGVLTQTGIKFGTAITPDGRVARSQALLDLAVKEGLPRLRISSNGKVTFLSAKDAFNAGRMKKLGKDYESWQSFFNIRRFNTY